MLGCFLEARHFQSLSSPHSHTDMQGPLSFPGPAGAIPLRKKTVLTLGMGVACPGSHAIFYIYLLTYLLRYN